METTILWVIIRKADFLVIVCLTLLMMLLSGCYEEVLQVSAPTVVVSPAEKRDVSIYGDCIGITKASLDVEG
jgi:hypothetical protein